MKKLKKKIRNYDRVELYDNEGVVIIAQTNNNSAFCGSFSNNNNFNSGSGKTGVIGKILSWAHCK